MKTCNSILEAQAVAGVIAIWAGPPVIAYEQSDSIAPEHLPGPVNDTPQEVTMRQARLALLGAGLLDDVEAAITAMTGATKTQALIEWEYSGTVQRHKGLVSQMAETLGLTAAQVDALFVTASTL